MIMVSICVDNVVMLETFIDNLANICSVNVYSYFEFDHSHCHRDDDAAARTPERYYLRVALIMETAPKVMACCKSSSSSISNLLWRSVPVWVILGLSENGDTTKSPFSQDDA